MASSSLSLSRNWRFQVFPSFCGDDVRRTFLSHFLKEFKRKGIDTFIDNEIKRSESIGTELVRAIRESRIAIVVLSKNYASSSWCLNELLEIVRCKEEIGQTVVPIFYAVDPSDVRNQTGDFGRTFEETCLKKTEEEKQRWRRALIDVANIAGEDSCNWNNEAEMIEKIATDVSNELNCTPSRDFDELVGIEARIAKMYSLLCLESCEVMIVGIWGPAGIGKTTIARALYDRLSGNFQLTAFLENIKGSYARTNLDEYSVKLHLQTQLLSNIINQKDIKIRHLGAVEERLKNHKVLVVLDDVDELEQLNALANQYQWFGSGSRIIVTTEDTKLLKAHGINHTYEVDFPSRDNALQIFCQSAFGQKFPYHDFVEVAVEVTDIAGRLPLGLSILGSHLRGMSKDECVQALPRLRTSLDGKIEKVLRYGYDVLNDKDKALFLHTACLFNGECVDRVKRLLQSSNLDVCHGLGVLAQKSLISTIGRRVNMHYLLQQVGREIVRKQSVHEPGKRQFLVDAMEICDLLVDNTGTATVLGISFGVSEIKEELYMSDEAFTRMPNLQFLEIYKKRRDSSVRLQFPQGLKYLPRKLRLLHWDEYPMKSLPCKFYPEFLVELKMQCSKLEKLWEDIQPLRSLKVMDLRCSKNLKEIPDLSNAINLKELHLDDCRSLVELPSTIRNLEKLTMSGCKSLKSFPNVPNTIEEMDLSETGIEEVPPWIQNLFSLLKLYMQRCTKLNIISSNISKLESLQHLIIQRMNGYDSFSARIIYGSDSQQTLTLVLDHSHDLLPICLPEKTYTCPVYLDLRGNDFENIPDCIRHLSGLRGIWLSRCRNLKSLPQLPDSLSFLGAAECKSLERISGSLSKQVLSLNFANCLKLNQESRELIQTLACRYALLPSREVSAYFTHRANGNSLTIPLKQRPLPLFLRFKACVLLDARSGVYNDYNDNRFGSQGIHLNDYNGSILRASWRTRGIAQRDEWNECDLPVLVMDHLFTFEASFSLSNDPEGELMFEFEVNRGLKIKGCGVKFLEEGEGKCNKAFEDYETQYEEERGDKDAETWRCRKRMRK